jgi:hypothetical protein
MRDRTPLRRTRRATLADAARAAEATGRPWFVRTRGQTAWRAYDSARYPELPDDLRIVGAAF